MWSSLFRCVFVGLSFLSVNTIMRKVLEAFFEKPRVIMDQCLEFGCQWFKVAKWRPLWTFYNADAIWRICWINKLFSSRFTRWRPCILCLVCLVVCGQSLNLCFALHIMDTFNSGIMWILQLPQSVMHWCFILFISNRVVINYKPL